MMQPSSPDVVEVRLRSIEESLKDARTQATANAAATELRLASISTELKGLQLMMPDHFMPRRESENTSKQIETRVKTLEDRAWAVFLAAFTGVISLGIAVATWFLLKP